ncbi:transposase, partial [Microbulbifer epialgicus]
KRIEQDPNVKRQKDLDARWTKKNNERYYGYKDHVCIDNKQKLIREYEVTSAEVHDSHVGSFINYWHPSALIHGSFRAIKFRKTQFLEVP